MPSTGKLCSGYVAVSVISNLLDDARGVRLPTMGGSRGDFKLCVASVPPIKVEPQIPEYGA
jgi:hypothetical protein